MGVYTKPLDLYKAQINRFNVAKLNQAQGHRLLALQGLQDARELTSGPLGPDITQGAFARGESPALSTPTGRRRTMSAEIKKARGLGKSGVPLLPINVQSGDLRRSHILIQRSSRPQVFDLTQRNPGGGLYTLYPGGTRKMVGRGFWRQIRTRWRSRNAAFFDYYKSVTSKP